MRYAIKPKYMSIGIVLILIISSLSFISVGVQGGTCSQSPEPNFPSLYDSTVRWGRKTASSDDYIHPTFGPSISYFEIDPDIPIKPRIVNSYNPLGKKELLVPDEYNTGGGSALKWYPDNRIVTQSFIPDCDRIGAFGISIEAVGDTDYIPNIIFGLYPDDHGKPDIDNYLYQKVVTPEGEQDGWVGMGYNFPSQYLLTDDGFIHLDDFGISRQYIDVDRGKTYYIGVELENEQQRTYIDEYGVERPFCGGWYWYITDDQYSRGRRRDLERTWNIWYEEWSDWKWVQENTPYTIYKDMCFCVWGWDFPPEMPADPIPASGESIPIIRNSIIDESGGGINWYDGKTGIWLDADANDIDALDMLKVHFYGELGNFQHTEPDPSFFDDLTDANFIGTSNVYNDRSKIFWDDVIYSGDIPYIWAPIVRDWGVQRRSGMPWEFYTLPYQGIDPVVKVDNQTIKSVERFEDIILKDCVIDGDNDPESMTWEITDDGDCDLDVEIIERKTIRIEYDQGWSGSETLTFTATDPDGNSGSDDATFTVIDISNYPSICVQKTPSLDQINSGEEVTYFYNVTNDGYVDLINVELIDDKLGLIEKEDVSDLVLSPGETWIYEATTVLYSNTTNVAIVTADVVGYSLQVSAGNSAFVEVKQASEDAIIEKYVRNYCDPQGDTEHWDKYVEVGLNDLVVFQIMVENIGDTVLDLQVEDVLPSNLQYFSHQDENPQPDEIVGNKIYWNINGLNPGGQFTITYFAKGTSYGVGTNWVYLIDDPHSASSVIDQDSAIVNVKDGGGDDDDDDDDDDACFTKVMIMRPLEEQPFLYIQNEEKFPFMTNVVIGAFEINATVVDTCGQVTNVKFFIEGEEKANIPYNPTISYYTYTLEDKTLFWNTMEVAVYSGTEKIEEASSTVDVFAIIL